MRGLPEQVKMQTFRFHKKHFTDRWIWTEKYADSSLAYERLFMNKRKISVLHSPSPLCYLEKSKPRQSEDSGRQCLMLITGLETQACIAVKLFLSWTLSSTSFYFCKKLFICVHIPQTSSLCFAFFKRMSGSYTKYLHKICLIRILKSICCISPSKVNWKTNFSNVKSCFYCDKNYGLRDRATPSRN